MNKILKNNDGHLRSIIQIAIAAFTFLFISTFGQGFVGTFIYRMTEAGIFSSSILNNYFLTGALPETFLNFFAGGLILLEYKLLNKKSLSEMGFTPVLKSRFMIPSGILLIGLLLSCITLVLLLTGSIKFTGIQFHISILQYIMIMTSVSFVEEILNRGFIQHLVGSRHPVVPSIIIPALVFMSFHLQNPDMTKLGLLNIFIVGIFFSVVTYKTESIWCAFGAHIMWNVGSACIFGLMGVSQTTGSILNFQYLKETAFNGYGVSPLYGLVGTVFWTALTIIFVFGTKRKQYK